MRDNKVDKRDFSAVPQGALRMMCGISEAAATAGAAWAAGLRAPLPVLHDEDQTLVLLFCHVPSGPVISSLVKCWSLRSCPSIVFYDS